MGKIISLLMGAVVTVLGFILLIKWWDPFLNLVLGLLPVALVLTGIVALLAGFSELKDALAEKK